MSQLDKHFEGRGDTMKVRRIRIQVAALAFIMLPAVAGVVAVRASATCERFVRTYVTKPVRNRVSEATAEAWAKWRTAHPNWKPNPKLHRPKYVMTREESVQKVAFACSVPLIDTAATQMFPPNPPPMLNFSRMQPPEIQLEDAIPPEVADVTPVDEWPPLEQYVPPVLNEPVPPGGIVFPIIPPGGPPIPGEVPEPASLLLVATGLAALCLRIAAQAGTALSRES